VTANEAPPPAEPADLLDGYIDAAAQMLGLPLDAAWKPAVKANLAVNLRLGAIAADLTLSDEAEPAPVFGA
jgi:1-carboxybiuret hydrolase subunit AtzG-like protein